MISKDSTSQTVFEAVDSDMRSAIIKLNKKLRDLQGEIAAKLIALESSTDTQGDAPKKQLFILAQEVERALQSIDDVVNVAVSNDSEFLKLHHEDLEKFRKMITTNTEKIAKLNEKL